jgi:hypothetical protein
MSSKTLSALVPVALALAAGCLDRKNSQQDASRDLDGPISIDRSADRTGDIVPGQPDTPLDTVAQGPSPDSSSYAGMGGSGGTAASGGGGAIDIGASLSGGGGSGIDVIVGTGGSGAAGGIDSGTGGILGNGGSNPGVGGSGAGGLLGSGGAGTGGLLGNGGSTSAADARPSPDLPPDRAEPDVPLGPDSQPDAPGTCPTGETWCTASSSCVAAGACCTSADCTITLVWRPSARTIRMVAAPEPVIPQVRARQSKGKAAQPWRGVA